MSPYVSLAQARKFHADPKLRKYTKEFDAATNFAHLPERATPVRRKGVKEMHKRRHSNLTKLLAAGGNHRA